VFKGWLHQTEQSAALHRWRTTTIPDQFIQAHVSRLNGVGVNHLSDLRRIVEERIEDLYESCLSGKPPAVKCTIIFKHGILSA